MPQEVPLMPQAWITKVPRRQQARWLRACLGSRDELDGFMLAWDPETSYMASCLLGIQRRARWLHPCLGSRDEEDAVVIACTVFCKRGSVPEVLHIESAERSTARQWALKTTPRHPRLKLPVCVHAREQAWQ
eukprot:1158977-Pelagomonas_calceolata.AAC.11